MRSPKSPDLPTEPKMWRELGEHVADSAGDAITVLRVLRQGLETVQEARARKFLSSIRERLDADEEGFGEELARRVEDPRYRELLLDFLRECLSTPSRTALAALGVLYADVCEGGLSPGFARQVANALAGLDDRLIEVALWLDRLEEEQPTENRSDTDNAQLLREEDLQRLEEDLRDGVPNLQEDFDWMLAELKRRGLLAEDSAGARYSDGWVAVYETNPATKRICQRLREAQALTDEASASDGN